MGDEDEVTESEYVDAVKDRWGDDMHKFLLLNIFWPFLIYVIGRTINGYDVFQ